MAQSDADRSQAATPHKLAKARERGQVAKSPDVISATVFMTAMMFLTWQGWPVWRAQFELDRAVLLQSTRVRADLATVWPLLEHMLQATMLAAAPFFAALVVAALLSNLVQTGAVFSVEPIKPDWNRLNPVTGFKRVFSTRTLFLAFRALLKLVLLGAVAYFALKALLPQFYQLAALSPLGLMKQMLADLGALGLRIGAMLVFIAVIDWVYSRREFARKMRMSKREIKDEVKNRDGDPRIRGRLRELRRDMLKRSLALRNTRKADVLITNPTHVAVALRYVHGEMSSPQLVAKGRGFMAAAMRKIAARHRIPVVQNPSLARTLYRNLGIDQHVQPDLYAQVARIIVWVFARRDAMRASGRKAPPVESRRPRTPAVPREAL